MHAITWHRPPTQTNYRAANTVADHTLHDRFMSQLVKSFDIHIPKICRLSHGQSLRNANACSVRQQIPSHAQAFVPSSAHNYTLEFMSHTITRKTTKIAMPIIIIFMQYLTNLHNNAHHSTGACACLVEANVQIAHHSVWEHMTLRHRCPCMTEYLRCTRRRAAQTADPTDTLISI